MSVIPTVSADGVGVVAAGQLNAYMISATNTATMRSVVGQSGMSMYLQGTYVPNDGGQGNFYWNYASVAPDDNLNVITPYGTVQGAWIRQAVVVTNTGPAFSAYMSSNQTVTTGQPTKLAINTKEFDTSASYDATTNYRFFPLTAGYYQINGATLAQAGPGSSTSISIYKNGSIFKNGSSFQSTSTTFSTINMVVSTLIYMNGSTDYCELWASVSGAGVLQFISGAANTYFSASLSRNQ
jgi:hypothetical protein